MQLWKTSSLYAQRKEVMENIYEIAMNKVVFWVLLGANFALWLFDDLYHGFYWLGMLMVLLTNEVVKQRKSVTASK